MIRVVILGCSYFDRIDSVFQLIPQILCIPRISGEDVLGHLMPIKKCTDVLKLTISWGNFDHMKKGILIPSINLKYDKIMCLVWKFGTKE